MLKNIEKLKSTLIKTQKSQQSLSQRNLSKMRSDMKTKMNNAKAKPATLNKTQALIAQRKADAKAKLPEPKPKKDKSAAKAAYAEAKENGIDYNKYKSLLIASRRQRPDA